MLQTDVLMRSLAAIVGGLLLLVNMGAGAFLLYPLYRNLKSLDVCRCSVRRREEEDLLNDKERKQRKRGQSEACEQQYILRASRATRCLWNGMLQISPCQCRLYRSRSRLLHSSFCLCMDSLCGICSVVIYSAATGPTLSCKLATDFRHVTGPTLIFSVSLVQKVRSIH